MSAAARVREFGVLPDGRPVAAVELRAGSAVAVVLTLGGILQSLRLPDRHGMAGEVTLGHDDIGGYLASRAYPGAIIGRTAGRIAGGQLRVDGVVHQLARNEGDNTLHGGPAGFDRALWRLVAAGSDGDAATLDLAHHSPAGDQGYPGALSVAARYRLTADTLSLTLSATSDAPTCFNPSWHPYWNLGSAPTIAGHRLQLDASGYYPSGAGQVTARAAPLTGTPFALAAPTPLAEVLAAPHPQAQAAHGIDHVFVRGGAAVAARLDDPASGRWLEVASAAPALVVYTGAWLGGGPAGHGGRAIHRHGGIALEPQALPDALPLLRPGDRFDWAMTLRFGAA